MKMKPYEILRKQVRVGTESGKGYSYADFVDAWDRYLPVQPHKSVTTVTTGTKPGLCGLNAPPVTDVPYVTYPGEADTETCLRCGGEGCPYCRGQRPKPNGKATAERFP